MGATVEAANGRYGAPSESVIQAVPVRAAGQLSQETRPKLRARDLIAELDSINAQIQTMMLQVERAVAHLALSRF